MGADLRGGAELSGVSRKLGMHRKKRDRQLACPSFLSLAPHYGVGAARLPQATVTSEFPDEALTMTK
jgi:hypothetical protein